VEIIPEKDEVMDKIEQEGFSETPKINVSC
jgi:hypothetical protein